MKLLQFFGFGFLVLQACTQPPEYPVEPVIEYLSVSKNTMREGKFQEDTIYVTIGFTDGDGDIGREDTDNTIDLFVTDLRTGITDNTYKVPYVPELGSGNGISGTITFQLYATCCIFDEPGYVPCEDVAPAPFDTVRYEIYLIDRAGHVSNTVQTEPIFIQCRQ